MSKEIEELVQNCSACQEVRNKPPLAMLHPGPGQDVHGKGYVLTSLDLFLKVC